MCGGVAKGSVVGLSKNGGKRKILMDTNNSVLIREGEGVGGGGRVSRRIHGDGNKIK